MGTQGMWENYDCYKLKRSKGSLVPEYNEYKEKDKMERQWWLWPTIGKEIARSFSLKRCMKENQVYFFPFTQQPFAKKLWISTVADKAQELLRSESVSLPDTNSYTMKLLALLKIPDEI